MSDGLFDYEPKDGESAELYDDAELMTAHIISNIEVVKRAALIAGVTKKEFDETIIEMLVDLITDAYEAGILIGTKTATEKTAGVQDERVAELEKLLADQYTKAHHEGHTIGRALGLREAADEVRGMNPGRNIQARMADKLDDFADKLMKDYVGPGETSVVPKEAAPKKVTVKGGKK